MEKQKNLIGRILFILVFILLSSYLLNCNRQLKDELAIKTQNERALSDSVRTLKNSLGEEVKTKSVLIADQKRLKDLNRSLFEDVKRLEGKVITIQTSTGKINNVKDKPIVVNNTITKYPDGTNELSWKLDTVFSEGNSRTLAAKTSFQIDSCGIVDKGTKIIEDGLSVKITTGLVKLNDTYQVQVTTSYPGMKFTQIDGAILDPDLFKKSEESDIVFGPSISVGYSVGWDQIRSGPSVGPAVNVGFSATFNLNKYAKKISNWFK